MESCLIAVYDRCFKEVPDTSRVRCLGSVMLDTKTGRIVAVLKLDTRCFLLSNAQRGGDQPQRRRQNFWLRLPYTCGYHPVVEAGEENL